jgi:hypothetical protein
MKCEEVRRRLVDYLEKGAVHGERSIAVHIEECAACRGEYEGLRDTLRLVKAVPVEDPGPEFWRENRAKIRAAVAARRGRREGWRFRNLGGLFRVGTRLPGPAGLAGALLGVLFVISAMLVLRDSRGPGSGSAADLFTAREREALGEIYVSGALFPDARPEDDLAWLSEPDLVDVLRTMESGTGAAALDLESRDGGAWNAFEMEEEIRGLDPEQLDRLIEALKASSVRG